MLHIPILRNGNPYTSVESVELVHHATGDPMASVSQANSGMVVRDIGNMDDCVLESFTVRELFDLSRKAAELFMTASLPVGDEMQTFDDYVNQLSSSTGMPVGYCRNNAAKIHRVMDEIEIVVGGLTRGFDVDILDQGYGTHNGGTLSYFREGRIFGAVLPSNSPGVHSLWIPAISLKAPIVLKPGREEPWTPFRVIQAFIAAGVPKEAFGFYPTDHGGAAELLRCVDRSMIFGDANTTRPYENNRNVEIHGPGYSKVLLDDKAADNWQDCVDMIVASIETNGGRSCINASAVWTPKNGRKIAEAVAEQLAKRQALPADDPNATLAAFANPLVAERISDVIDHGLREGDAVDLAEQFRGSPRLVKQGRIAYLLPSVVWCPDREHALANREFLFPFASVIECPTSEMPNAIGKSLIVSAITDDPEFRKALMDSPNIDRLNFGMVPTFKISWDQPHEGNLFEHLYRQRAFQIEPAA